MMRKYLFFILLIKCVSAEAQDPHFSQYYASPLTLNPAMTGFTDADSRLDFNFRTQYWSVGKPFTTGTVSYQTNIANNSFPINDKLGVGIMGMYDCSSGGGFKNLNIAASGAYHKALDIDGFKMLTLGFQATLASRKITYEGLYFANQFTSGGFDPSLPTNENYLVSTKTYVDMNVGLLYSYKGESRDFYIGSSLYHFTRPNISFTSDDQYRLPMRLALHAGGRFSVNDNNDDIFFSGAYMGQAGARDEILGVAYGINLSKTEEENFRFTIGTWYRIKESIIPYIGMDYGNLQWGLTYDIVNSDLRLASPKTGSFELSFAYLINKTKNYYNSYQKGRF